ncbi:MAG: hypothetical protein KIT69_16265, partial [Propionibacteriaceae bacterium]|nr:hypothetical protein [Propionibacteriaceae bacterium]
NLLTGTIPSPEICLLTKLTILHLQNNLLEGSIPDCLTNINSLKSLKLSYNLLTGNIPTTFSPQFTPLPQLEECELAPQNTDVNGFYCISEVINVCMSDKKLCILSNLQLQALADLRDNLSPVEDWIGEPTCDWPYIDCNEKGLVTKIDLSLQSLTGTLPNSIGYLGESLEYFSIHSNKINGPIQDSIGNLTALTYLNFAGNQLTGSIPITIGDMNSLEFLSLSHNQLSGSIPDTIANIVPLKRIYIIANHLSGSIPDSISTMSSLLEIDLSSNKLEGYIPDNIGNVNTLEVLNLANNQINGTIPESITLLSSLRKLFLNDNMLTGSIPEENISNLTSLEYLILNNNQLSGPIPSKIGDLISLQELNLQNNMLNGHIPSNIGNSAMWTTSIKVIDLRNNQITGVLPKSIGQSSSSSSSPIEQLYLSNNMLYGSIPDDIGTLLSLKVLDIQANNLNGTIPESIGNCTSLEILNLEGNNLIGSIPISIGNDDNNNNNNNNSSNNKPLKYLNLANNQLSGYIPNSIGFLNSLEYLNISYNNIEGFIPFSMANLVSINYLDMSNNNLTGNIPAIVQLNLGPLLKELNLANNKLSGEIFDELCIAPATIVKLILSYNNFNGSLPSCSISTLKILHLNDNEFDSGGIPSTFGQLNSLESLKIHNNKLVGTIPSSMNNENLPFLGECKLEPQNTINVGFYCINPIPIRCISENSCILPDTQTEVLLLMQSQMSPPEWIGLPTCDWNG